MSANFKIELLIFPLGVTLASYNLGCLTGALITIWLGNILGRRKAIFLGSAIMVIGGILQCSSFSLPQLIVGRIVTGIGNGLNTSTGPTWQSECSKSHRRGQLVMIEGALITGGIMISCMQYFPTSTSFDLEKNLLNSIPKISRLARLRFLVLRTLNYRMAVPYSFSNRLRTCYPSFDNGAP